LDGRVWSGRSGYAGELGHVQVDPTGVRCNCGSWGCVETYAGAPHWRRRAALALEAGRTSTLRETALDPKAIVEAARAGDALAVELVDGAASALGTGIAAALSLLNLESVVIGGGLAAAGPFLLERIVEQTRRRVFAQVFTDCAFSLTELGADAGVVGAARVAILGRAD
jgi:glucokinase